ncbi:hypothetical protein AYI69_g5140, partial [Smittium culicis]
MPIIAASTNSFVEVWDLSIPRNSKSKLNTIDNSFNGSKIDDDNDIQPTNYGSSSSIFEPFRNNKYKSHVTFSSWLGNGIFYFIPYQLTVYFQYTQYQFLIIFNSAKYPIDILTTNHNSEYISSASSFHPEISFYNRNINVKSSLISIQKEKIKSLQLNSTQNSILLAGGDSGTLQLFDSTYTKSAPLRILPQVHLTPITSIKFSHIFPKIAYSSALDGYICLSDTGNKKSTILAFKSSCPITALEIGDNYGVYTGDIYGKVSFYDARKFSSPIWDRYVGLKQQ